jgi:hypothetical protein
MVLCLGVFWRLTAIAARRRSSAIVDCCGALVLALVIAANLRLFTDLNRVVQLAHFGHYGSEDLFEPMRLFRNTAGQAGTAVPQIPLYERSRGALIEAEFKQRLERLFPGIWEGTDFYRDFEKFQHRRYDSIDYEHLICAVYFQDRPCPVIFQMTDPSLRAHLSIEEQKAVARDQTRKRDLLRIRQALFDYKRRYGRYPCRDGDVWAFSTAGEGWIPDGGVECIGNIAAPFRMQDGSSPPLDPINDGAPFWTGRHVYGYRGWRDGCVESQRDQYFVLATLLERPDDLDSWKKVRDCDGSKIPWPDEVFALTSDSGLQPLTDPPLR